MGLLDQTPAFDPAEPDPVANGAQRIERPITTPSTKTRSQGIGPYGQVPQTGRGKSQELAPESN
jgi:hypothetical protein